MSTIALNILYTVIGAIVTFLLSFIGCKISVLIDTKVKDTKVATALKAATNSIVSAVKLTNQTYVDAVKKDGTFSANAQQNALELALATAKAQITSDTIKIIENTYGDFDNWLKTTIEATVADIKNNKSLKTD